MTNSISTRIGITAVFISVLLTVGTLYRLSPSFVNVWHPTLLFNQASLFASGNDKNEGSDEFLLGVGKADITGPVVEINFMGYADPKQLGSGVRQRLYSRAFIVGDVDRPDDRFVYLVLDTQSGDTAVRHGILEALESLGPDYAVYTKDNVAVTGTHSHSGPGAFLNYLLPQITSKGFHHPSYQAIVDGAVASIQIAHENLAAGQLSVGEIEIPDANINRSPYAYLANPAEERARYAHDVDKAMTLLRFTHSSPSGPKDIGILTFFAVHGTSMHGNNTLVTGDNKGVAAIMFEQSTLNPSFVAGFSQANVGDTTPNILGAFCESGPQIGQACDFKTSLCNNLTQPCHGRGPYFGRDDAGTASTYEIGRRQFHYAQTLFSTPSLFTPILPSRVSSIHQFTDFSTFTFLLPNGTLTSTCPAALGYSFAAGTSDGPGAFDFKQGQPNTPHANPLWSAVRNAIHTPNSTQLLCHGEKPILLDVGESTRPYLWSPNIVDTQLLRAGNLFLIVSPGEATTMAGRRWREALSSAISSSALSSSSTPSPVVLLGGPANTYTHYITTREEYSVQRYEGASTLYGASTLDAYINLTLSSLLPAVLPSSSSSSSSSPSPPQLPLPGPSPPIYTNTSLSFITPVVFDRAPVFTKFGDVATDVRAVYRAGESVAAKFVAANPRNDLRLGRTYAAVERYTYPDGTSLSSSGDGGYAEAGRWERVRDDADWALVFEWRRTSELLATSEVTVRWETAWETGDWEREGVEMEGGEGEEEEEEGEGRGGGEQHGDLVRRRRRTRRESREELRGRYRLRYYGDAKGIGGKVVGFEGVSAEFSIV